MAALLVRGFEFLMLISDETQPHKTQDPAEFRVLIIFLW